MHKTSTIAVRIEPTVKLLAKKILGEVGLSEAEAVRIFFKQVCLHHGLPFSVDIPNKKTMKAIKEAKTGIGLTESKTVDDLFRELGI